MTETEQRYAQIEKEAQAIVWACDKFSCYILGKHFEIETDHKPLVPLLSTKHLDTLPPGILRFRLRLARFDYSINHVPGKSLLTADALSRAPCPPSSMENESITNSDVEVFVGAIISTIPITELDFMKYHTGQLNDPICIRVKQYCVSGWPAIQNIGVELIPYWRVRDDLSVCKDLLLYGTRIVVPTSLKSLTLQKLHQGHLGIQRCHLRAVSSVWWPGSSQQIYQMVKGCHVCARKNPPPIEPMIPSELPDYPWRKVSSDLFQLKGKMYLLVADTFHGFLKLFSYLPQPLLL